MEGENESFVEPVTPLSQPLLSAKDTDELEPPRPEGVVERRRDTWALYKEIATIALPMLATLAADPIAALVDTMFVGHIGRAELAGVGTAVSIFNTTTKLFNVPLLSVTTSIVATAMGRVFDGHDAISAAASSAIVIALVVGVVEAVLLGVGAPYASVVWGAPAGTDIYTHTLQFLRIRAFGAPITVVMLVLQGVFRGLQDTTTPFYATAGASAINVALDPVLIFVMELGVRGAAIATVMAQAVPCVVLLFVLARRYPLNLAHAATVKQVISLFAPTGYLILRTISITAVYAFATSLVDRAGTIEAATHQICFQLWMSTGMLSDALAVAAQTLIAKHVASGDAVVAQKVVVATVQVGFALGCTLLAILGGLQHQLPKLFTADEAVLAKVEQLMPFVFLSQPVNSLAFVWDGVLYGAGGFRYAATIMAVNAIPSIALMMLGAYIANNGTEQLMLIWAGLVAVMFMRVVTTYVPYRLRRAPFTSIFTQRVPLLLNEV